MIQMVIILITALVISYEASSCDKCLDYCQLADNAETGVMNSKGECICGYKADPKKVPIRVPNTVYSGKINVKYQQEER